MTPDKLAPVASDKTGPSTIRDALPETSAKTWRCATVQRFGLRIWARHLSLRVILTIVVTVAIVSAAAAVGSFAVRAVADNKQTDVWTILFLQLERRAQGLSERLIAADNAVAKKTAARRAVVSSHGLDIARPNAEPVTVDPGVDVDQAARAGDATVVNIEGETYLAHRTDLWPLKLVDLLRTREPGLSDVRTYAVSRGGQLLFTDSDDVTPSTLLMRPLVKKFLEGVTAQTQSTFRDAAGTGHFGFFVEVPRTNIVLFSEIREDTALRDVAAVRQRLLLVLSATALATGLLVQWPLARVLGPIRSVAQLSTLVSTGDFSVTVEGGGFGETAVMLGAFREMIRSLGERDRAIRLLMAEQEERLRLRRELEVARLIQENLLPKEPLPDAAGVSAFIQYMPAAVAAGDWYDFDFDPETGETVLTVADVSGHGVGSAMFTTVLASVFRLHVRQRGKSFDILGFIRDANALLGDLGRGAWHATLQVVRYVAGESQITIWSVGHPPCMVVSPDAGVAPRFVGMKDGELLEIGEMRSSLIGYAPTVDIKVSRVDLPRRGGIVLYSDGLIEARSPRGIAYGRKRLKQAVAAHRDNLTDTGLDPILNDWRKHCGGVLAEDDVCLIVLRRAA